MEVKFAFDLSRIWKSFGEGNFGFVSAYLSDLSPGENEARQQELKRQIRDKGYGFKEMKGVWLGGHEFSLFVPGATPEDMVWFGEEGWKPEAERKPQYSVIFAQGEGDAREVVHYNLREGIVIDRFVAMEVGLRDAWKSWTELRRHKFTFVEEEGEGKDKKASSDIDVVTWKHYIPPAIPCSSLMAGALGRWESPRTCGHYLQDRVIIRKAKY